MKRQAARERDERTTSAHLPASATVSHSSSSRHTPTGPRAESPCGRTSRGRLRQALLLEVATLCEDIAAAPTLEAALACAARGLPRVCPVERVVIALRQPPLHVDSREPRSQRSAALLSRPSHGVARAVPSAPLRLVLPISSGGVTCGTLQAEHRQARPFSSRDTALLRIVAVALGQAVPKHVAAAPLTGERTLSAVERARWHVLLGLVAHEVRTPLTTVKGHAQLLRRQVRAEVSADGVLRRGAGRRLLLAVERHLPLLERHLTYLERVLRDLLDLAHSEDGTLTLAPAPCDVVGLLQQTVDELEASDTDAVELRAPAVYWIECDPVRIRQVFHDLLRYALRRRHEQVTLHATVESWDGQAVRITIGGWRDDPMRGVEYDAVISPLDLELALSAAVVRLHGGKLSRMVEHGGAATLVLELPARANLIGRELGE
jgi:signal transduction histidine kinase